MNNLLNTSWVKYTLDGTLGGGAVSSPVWLTYLQTGATVLMIVGGAILLGLRIAIAIREYRNLKKGKD